MRKLMLIPFCTIGIACVFHKPGNTVKDIASPYIDSTGYFAARDRIENLDRAESGALIAQAFQVPSTPAEQEHQPVFFQSLEESYQRYVPFFRRDRRSKIPQVVCAYDLRATIERGIFDPQPFFNVLLHTMGFPALSTLDYVIEKGRDDSILVHVAYTRAEAGDTTGGIGISEGTLTLAVAGRMATLRSLVK